MAKAKQAKSRPVKTDAKKKTRKEKAFKPAKPQVPSVNLLPPRLEFEKNKQTTKRSMTVIAIGFVSVCVVLFGGQLVLNHFATTAVDNQRALLEAKQEELTGMDSIAKFVESIERRDKLIATLQGDQMNYVAITNDLLDAIPATGAIESLSLTVSKARTGTPVDLAGACGPVVDPIGIQDAAIVGCLSATITVPLSADPAAMTGLLSESVYLVNVDIATVETETPATDPEGVPTVQRKFKITAAVVSAGLLRAAPAEIVKPTTEPAAEEGEE